MRRFGTYLWEFSKLAILALIIVIPFRIFIAQPFVVSGDSMQPTFHANDYLVIDSLTYYRSTPQRGDVIVFRYPLDPSIYFIKRIVGLPGEVVKTNGSSVTIRGSADQQRSIFESSEKISPQQTTYATTTMTLAKDEYFVMGDNRFESTDSRDWGPLKQKFIIGRVVFRLLPTKDFGSFDALATFPVSK